jgi:hypothetical protein
MSTNGYTEGQLLNMDETAIYLDRPSNYTYSKIGEKRVKASTAGGERTRLSAAFTAAANGYKLPIFAIIPRQTPVPQLDGIHNMVFKYRTKATFDESVILEYLQRIVVPYMQAHAYDSILIILDQANCHMTATVS